MRRPGSILLAITLCAGFVVASQGAALAAKAAAVKESPVDEKACFDCHDLIKELKGMGRHKSLNCVTCHGGTAAHLKDENIRPSTHLDPETCGSCHKDQFDTQYTLNYKKGARSEKSLMHERSPNPLWDKLMMGHGFTKEHAAPRSHAYMLVDQIVVDRAFGGRFQPKDGWSYVAKPGPQKLWDVLYDTRPDNNTQKAWIPESAAAANPTCMQCKTQDQILKWKYLGDKDEKAKWSRQSNPVDFVKDVSNALNCFICHDPHAAKPRIVRDGLIAALTRPEKDTVWHKDPKATKITVKEFRGGFRKIALLEKYDTKLLCGQCHVEYNCNAGTDPSTGKPVGYDDQRTNHFPFKDVFQIYDHYNALGFRDFRHTLTGGLLWKGQHPETETFWNSKHDKAGVGCGGCHMPKVKGKSGKMITSHWETSPRNYLKQTCLTAKCHPALTEEQALYEIDAIKNFTKGKMRKAEFWLGQLIDKIVEGKKAGVDEAAIKTAQDRHDQAHILWEWWTAENSDGFHNPSAARESLTKSVEKSKEGIKAIDDALKAKVVVK